MSPVQRPLSGDVLVFDLNAEHETTADPALLARSGRSARTLFKIGGIRATLIVLAAGGETSEHVAEGPITIQPVSGTIRFTANGQDYDLRPGDLLSAAPAVRHRVTSKDGGAFLLTLVQ